MFRVKAWCQSDTHDMDIPSESANLIINNISAGRIYSWWIVYKDQHKGNFFMQMSALIIAIIIAIFIDIFFVRNTKLVIHSL